MDSFHLTVSVEGENKYKLAWGGIRGGEYWMPPSYSVDKSALKQLSEAIRKDLYKIASTPNRVDASEFAESLRSLAHRGRALFKHLQPKADLNEDELDLTDVRDLFETALRSVECSSRPPLTIVLQVSDLFVPWGFVFSGDVTALPSSPSLSLDDMQGFWLAHFRISVIYGGVKDLPKKRLPSFRTLYALDRDMFTAARTDLGDRCPTCLEHLDQLLDVTPAAAMDWGEFGKAWECVRDEHDSLWFVFGHSDGTRILLGGAGARGELLAAELLMYRKRNKDSASVFFLNGCRTAAPLPETASVPVSANFLAETRRFGCYGFIGTEVELTNTAACHYGTEFLWKLCKEFKSVGEAFDELQCSKKLFPYNLFYTCYAERKFRFVPVLLSAEVAA